MHLATRPPKKTKKKRNSFAWPAKGFHGLSLAVRREQPFLCRQSCRARLACSAVLAAQSSIRSTCRERAPDPQRRAGPQKGPEVTRRGEHCGERKSLHVNGVTTRDKLPNSELGKRRKCLQVRREEEVLTSSEGRRRCRRGRRR